MSKELEEKVAALEEELKKLRQEFESHIHLILGTRCYYSEHQKSEPCKTAPPAITPEAIQKLKAYREY